MATTSEVLARLGIETKDIPKDLAEADKFFKKFSSDLEKDSGKAGESGGKKFAKAFGAQLSGQARGAIVAALGLSAQGIADKIAAVFVGGSKEAFEKFGAIADANSAMIGERIAENLTPKKLAENLEKEFEAAKNAAEDIAQALGGRDDLESRTKIVEAQNKALVIERKLAELRKQDRDAAEKFAQDQRDFQFETISQEEKLSVLKAEVADLQNKLVSGVLSEKEAYEESSKVLEKQLEIRKIEQEISADLVENEKKRADEAKKRTAAESAAAKQVKNLRGKAGGIQDRIGEANTELSDRSRTTIGELANLSSFTPGVSVDAAAAAKRAQEVLRLEQEAERARLSGDQSGAAGLLGQAGQLRDELVQSGFTKSTEGDPAAKIVAELGKQTVELKTVLEEIREIEKGRYVNQ